jgi:hypothetical protein
MAEAVSALSRLMAKMARARVEYERPVADMIRAKQDARAMHGGVYLLWRQVRNARTEIEAWWMVKDACDDDGWLHVLAEHLDPGGVRLTPKKREALARRVAAVQRRADQPTPNRSRPEPKA